MGGCGAFTGEMAVEQMKDMGITNVLIGHSERRGEFGLMAYDTNETLATKLKYILDAGLTCVYCIGEPKEIREKGIEAVLAEMEAAQETHKGIRDMIKEKGPEGCAEAIRIQYGGSANAKNAPDLSAQPDIDGFLVGGASLKPEIADVIKAIAEAKC